MAVYELGSGSETFIGSSGSDTIVGRVGNDAIYGSGADDAIEGDWTGNSGPLVVSGNDLLVGEAGNDILGGGGGADTLSGGTGNDQLYLDEYLFNHVGADPSTLMGGVRSWLLSDGWDTTVGTTGNDLAYSEDGNDFITSLTGNDTHYGGAGADTLNGGSGNDSLMGEGGADSIVGNDGADTIVGDAASDTSTYGNDTVMGGAGSDLVYGYAGADNLSGGTDNDNLYGGADNDTLNGNEGDDNLYGEDGADTLSGGAGNDWLVGGAGNNSLSGGDGDDYLQIDSTSGADTIDGGLGSDRLYVDRSSGSQTIVASFADTTTAVSLWTGGPSVKNIEMVQITAGSGNDQITGTDSNDFLKGGAGNDTLDAGAGYDLVTYTTGNDVLIGGSGIDQLILDFGSSSQAVGFVFNGPDVDTPLGATGRATGFERLIFWGGAGADTVSGNADYDELRGYGGADSIFGGAGSDVVYGNTQSTKSAQVGQYAFTYWTEYGGDSSDTLHGGSGNDTIYAGDSDVIVYSGNWSDYSISNYLYVTNHNGTKEYKWTVTDRVADRDGTDTVIETRSTGLVFRFADGDVAGANVLNVVPTALALSNTSVVETAALGTVVGTLSATDANARDHLTYSITTAAGLPFAVSGDKLVVSGALDFETRSSWSVILRATDAAGASTSRNLTISVGDADDAPTGVTLSNTVASLAEGATATRVADIAVVDVDAGPAVLALAGADASRFEIRNGSELWFLGGDFESKTHFDVSVSVDAPGVGATPDATTAFALDLTDVDEFDVTAPVDGDPTPNTIAFDAPDTLTVSGLQLTAHDADATNSAVTFRLVDPRDADEFTLTEDGVLRGRGLFDRTLGADRVVTVEALSADGSTARADVVVHLLGTETLRLGGADADVVTGTDTAEEIWAVAGNDSIDGGGGGDTVYAGLGEDSVFGGAGADVVDLGGGNDTVDGGIGADTLIGGAGNDWYYLDQVGDRVVEAAGGGVDRVCSAVDYTLGAEIENLAFVGGGNHFGYGNDGANKLTGGIGDDTLIGMGGNDTLAGGAGRDVLSGFTGDDVYIIDDTRDTIIELNGYGFDWLLTSVDFLVGGQAIEQVTATGTGTVNIFGNYDFGTRLIGNAGINNLYGYAGNDTLSGGGGADWLGGGGGNDTYYLGATAGATVFERSGEGRDSVSAGFTYTLTANVETLTLTGADAVDGTGNELANGLFGNAAANTLTGLAGNDTLDGGVGADTLVGGLGDDVYYVDDAGDVIVEVVGEGSDLVYVGFDWVLADNVEKVALTGAAAIDATGNAANNKLTGNAGANDLLGLAGNDTLSGGGGDDLLAGGVGADVLTGGAGADRFLFDAAPLATAIDRVSDFSHADGDRIVLDHLIFTGLATVDGHLDAAMFATAAPTTADQHVLWDATSGTLSWDADGSGATAAVKIATFTAGLTLAADDFLLA